MSEFYTYLDIRQLYCEMLVAVSNQIQHHYNVPFCVCNCQAYLPNYNMLFCLQSVLVRKLAHPIPSEAMANH